MTSFDLTRRNQSEAARLRGYLLGTRHVTIYEAVWESYWISYFNISFEVLYI
jgi:hypothetical protein